MTKRRSGRPTALRAIILIALPALLLGCEDGRKIGVINQCATPVQVASQDNAAPLSLAWRIVDSGRSAVLSLAAEKTAEFFFWIRVPGTARPEPVRIPLSSLIKPSSGSGFDRGLVISGSLCPV